jgi:hypothetical protein
MYSMQDYKPLHSDRSHGIDGEPQVTVGLSLGCCRELSFVHRQTRVPITFPQFNGDVFAFGQGVNQVWLHGIPKHDANSCSGSGAVAGPSRRLSLILWGSKASSQKRAVIDLSPEKSVKKFRCLAAGAEQLPHLDGGKWKCSECCVVNFYGKERCYNCRADKNAGGRSAVSKERIGVKIATSPGKCHRCCSEIRIGEEIDHFQHETRWRHSACLG